MTTLNLDSRYQKNAETVLAAPTGGSDDAALFTAAVASLPSAGGRIVMQTGTYKLPSGFSFTKRVVLVGQGAGTYESSPTRIECSSLTSNCLTFTVAGSAIRDVGMINMGSSAPTAGAGILFAAGNWARITNVLVANFFNNLQFDQGYYYNVTDSSFLNPVNYGMWFRNTASNEFDHGDQSVQGCVITKYGSLAGGGTALRWESGGGLRFINNKINGGTQPGYTSTARFAKGVDIAVADGGATSVFVISGNSIENFSNSGVSIGLAGPSNTGTISKMVITSNEISSFQGGIGVAIVPAAAGKVSQIVISDNTFSDLTNAVSVANCDSFAIGTNSIISATNTHILIGTGCVNYTVTEQQVGQRNVEVLHDDNPSYDQDSHNWKQSSKFALSREIPNSSAASPVFKITVPPYSGGFVDLTAGGNVFNTGGFALHHRFNWYRQAASSAPVLAVLGSDETAGAAVSITQAASASGDITISIAPNTNVSGANVAGAIRMEVVGPVNSYVLS